MEHRHAALRPRTEQKEENGAVAVTAIAVTWGSLQRLGRGVWHHERASKEDARHPVEPPVDEEREAACRKPGASRALPREWCPPKEGRAFASRCPYPASIFDRRGGEWGREQFPR